MTTTDWTRRPVLLQDRFQVQLCSVVVASHPLSPDYAIVHFTQLHVKAQVLTACCDGHSVVGSSSPPPLPAPS